MLYSYRKEWEYRMYGIYRRPFKAVSGESATPTIPPASHKILTKTIVTLVPAPTLGSLLMEELNRREAWDREFEDNIPTNDAERTTKEQEHVEEMSLRRAWDVNSLNNRLTKGAVSTGTSVSVDENIENKRKGSGLKDWVQRKFHKRNV
jgi:hypothetical protein